MFFINGPIGNWKITDKTSDGFTVQNTKYEKVKLEVKDINYESHLNFPEVQDENVRTTLNDDIYNAPLIVKHDRKTMEPVAYGIGERRGREAILAAVTITVPKGYKITSIYNANVRLYSRHFDPESHFDFIGNFIPERNSGLYPRISVTAVDINRRMVVTYMISFNKKTNRLHVSTNRMNFEDIPKKGEKGFVRTDDFIAEALSKGYSIEDIPPIYFPNSPATAILVNSDTDEEFRAMLQEKGDRWKNNKYEVITGINDNDETAVETLKSLYDDGYRAVTLYLNDGEVTLDDVRDYEKWSSRFGPEISKVIINNFDSVNIVGTNALVYKRKVFGRKA